MIVLLGSCFEFPEPLHFRAAPFQLAVAEFP
jgi:hypothetical protein